MRARILLAAALTAVVAGLALPAAADPPAPASCVYVFVSDGFHIQIGSAPDGPESCIQLP
jgi:hypothetical protein